jgi:hypothetical protein
MVLGLGALLTAGVSTWGMASAAQALGQLYTGEVREINIHHCGFEPGTCEGSLVLAQAGGREVALAIRAGTTILRGEQRVPLDEIGVGNYVTVQARLLPGVTGDRLGFGLDEASRDRDRVGTSMGERPVTLQESSAD